MVNPALASFFKVTLVFTGGPTAARQFRSISSALLRGKLHEAFLQKRPAWILRCGQVDPGSEAGMTRKAKLTEHNVAEVWRVVDRG